MTIQYKMNWTELNWIARHLADYDGIMKCKYFFYYFFLSPKTDKTYIDSQIDEPNRRQTVPDPRNQFLSQTHPSWHWPTYWLSTVPVRKHPPLRCSASHSSQRRSRWWLSHKWCCGSMEWRLRTQVHLWKRDTIGDFNT